VDKIVTAASWAIGGDIRVRADKSRTDTYFNV